MKKEIIIAILIGLSLGLFITYGVYQAKTGISPESADDQAALNLNSENNEEFTGELIINSPEDEIIQTETTINVSGTTLANSFVVLFVGNDETITSSDESGNFASDLTLNDGANLITIIVLDESGRSIKAERTVIVSDDPLIEEASSAATNSESVGN